MNEYHISATAASKHFIDIEYTVDTQEKEELIFNLPAWRPGRYELANYAQNIQYWKAFDENDKKLPSKKLSKDSWHVKTAGAKTVTVKYNYYAFQLDAGASYFDENQLYVNPVNCLLYINETINDPCRLKLNIPSGYKIASGLVFNDDREAVIKDYHTLADSPFIASADLVHKDYSVGDYKFNIWIQGLCKPDWERVLKDFTAFSKAQIDMFGELPVKEYHFLFQVPSHKFYHGVEHLNSTVICLGPGYKLMENGTYTEFLGISSHELFHSWNIKSIRPIEMHPYDYSKENYSNLGYVAEGVTTYYGDLMLLRSGGYSWDLFSVEFSKFITRHFHNYGRDYQTLAESSFDTWLDGYKPGAPDRKVSMYVKGSLVALMKDIQLRKTTANTKSLDDVMRSLYYDFALQNKGYSEEDYLGLMYGSAEKFDKTFFDNFVWGLTPLDEYLFGSVDYLGCEIKLKRANDVLEDIFGIRLRNEGGHHFINQVAPESPGEIAALSINDELVAVNSLKIEDNLNDLMKFSKDGNVDLTVFRNKSLLHITLMPGKETYFPNYSLVKKQNATEEQKANFKLWANQEW